MVNQDILNYLKEGKKRGFTLNILKQKLIEGGFEEKDVNEAITEINKIESSQPVSQSTSLNSSQISPSTNQPNQSTNQSSQTNNQSLITNNQSPAAKSGAVWMKVSGILGIALLVFLSIFSFIVLSLKNTLLLAVYFIIIILFSCLYLFGFYKLGKFTDSKLLRLSSMFMIILLVLGLILTIILNLTNNNIENVLLSLSSSASSSLLTGLLIGGIVIILLCVISKFLFAIGLIKIGNQVKLAKLSGIFNLIVGILSLVTFILFVVLIFTGASLLTGLLSESNPSGVGAATSLLLFMISFGFLGFVKLISSIIEITLLFKANKQFR